MRFALGIDYEGTHYRGWQTQQEGVPSIQSTIEDVLSRIADHPVIIHAAGRTDAGVHASGMVAHFDTHAIRGHKSWLLGSNTWLPKDIALRWIHPVSEDFHARFKAVARRYRYIIFNSGQRSSQLAGKVTWHYHPLNFERMKIAASYLVGQHNFNSFRAVGCQSRNPNRHVHFLNLTKRGSLIILDIQADGFLHHMVRNIAGVLMAIGEGKAEPEWVQELLRVQDRTQGGVTASGSGLYFVDALYPPEFELPKEPLGPLWLVD
ncbi:tRNA pseudouridine(38-40) synthase TruA [uncultured Agitococcus sp.]|mgnify:FL=1|uniref:tRNA pseudouridine(38-40) synthase TruA n=1 Tax=uncultured Agitococcus sp. TaxID=1506599 RepID=UPI00262D6A21|nr:tRNA pseudouridine(38-40) synthase TruA [uncultured Agitococcus sp.]